MYFHNLSSVIYPHNYASLQVVCQIRFEFRWDDII